MAKKKESWERKRTKPSLTLPPPPAPSAPTPPLITTPTRNLDAVTDGDLERILVAIATFDPRRTLDAEGYGLRLVDLDENTALGISGFEVEELTEAGETRGGPRLSLGWLKKYRQESRIVAIKLLLQLHGRLKNETVAPDGEEDKTLDEAREEVTKIIRRMTGKK